MKLKEEMRWTALIRIIARSIEGEVLDVVEFENMVMNVGKNLARDVLSGAVTDGQIKYLALGNSATAVANTQTQLVAEQFRKLVTQRSTPGTGQVKTVTYVAPQEAVSFTINEIGWFAGASATGAANSGIMVSRVLYNRVKTNIEALQIERTDSFS